MRRTDVQPDDTLLSSLHPPRHLLLRQVQTFLVVRLVQPRPREPFARGLEFVGGAEAAVCVAGLLKRR